MAYTYLFFKPLRLPLMPDELSDETVLPLSDCDALREVLERAIPGIEWVEQPLGSAMGRAEIDGLWLELNLPGGGRDTLSLRCSLRADYRAIVQGLCDSLGWMAFDEKPMCYQPHRAPIPAG